MPAISVGNRATTTKTIKLDYPWQAWVVVLGAALFFFYEFIQMTMFNVINPQLMQTFHVTAEHLGNLSAMYFYANVVFLFPAGLLLDRFSTRKLITVAMALCVISTYGFALSKQFDILGAFRFITGLGSSFCMLSCVRLASRWFPPRRVALVIGLVVTMAMLGGMMGQTPMTFLSAHLGWRHAVMVNATIGLALVFVVWFVVRDYPKSLDAAHDQEQDKLNKMGFWQSIRLALKNPQNWLAGIYTNLLSLPIIVLGAMWGGMYLSQSRHLSHDTASYITSMIFLGTIFGSPAMGWLSDRIALRKLPMIVGAAVSLLLVLVIMYSPHLSTGMLSFMFFLLAFVASTQVIAYPLVVESNSFAITSAAEGVTCTIIMMAGAIFQPLYGKLMDMNWRGQVSHGAHIYSPHAYLIAMWIMPIAFVVALIAALMLKETRCKDLVP
jgi:MFS family permease